VAHIYFLIRFRNRMAVAIDWRWSYGPDEDPLIIDIGSPAGQLADEITWLLGTSVTIL
jgi:hypothetical protein